MSTEVLVPRDERIPTRQRGRVVRVQKEGKWAVLRDWRGRLGCCRYAKCPSGRGGHANGAGGDRGPAQVRGGVLKSEGAAEGCAQG